MRGQGYRWREGEVPRVAFVERDDEFRVPLFIAEFIEAQGIAGFVEAGDLDGESHVITGLVHGEETEHRIMATVVGEQDEER